MIQGTLAKAFGVMGGYVAGSALLVRFLARPRARLHLHQRLAAVVGRRGARRVRHLRRARPSAQRIRSGSRPSSARLAAAGLPVMPNQSHIVPVMVGDAAHCRLASDLLLREHQIYVQPINYPTVPRGTERLRLTPTPLHSDADIGHLVEALAQIWQQLDLRKVA